MACLILQCLLVVNTVGSLFNAKEAALAFELVASDVIGLEYPGL